MVRPSFNGYDLTYSLNVKDPPPVEGFSHVAHAIVLRIRGVWIDFQAEQE